VKFDGSKGGNKDFRIVENKGVCYRFDDPEKTVMIIGTNEKVWRWVLIFSRRLIKTNGRHSTARG
jgi:hypothetical protein